MASAATVEAILFSLRGGLSSLGDPAVLDRLSRCDEDAIGQIALGLRAWNAKGAPWLPPYTDDEIAALVDVWHTLRGH